MRIPHIIAAGTVCVVALALAAPAQSAPLQCSGAVSASAPDEDGLPAAWSDQVASQLGGDWANFALARNKKYDDIDLHLGGAKIWTVAAQPCRHMPIIKPIGDLGGLKLQPSDNPPPKHFGLGTRGTSGLSVMGGDDDDAPSPKLRAPKAGKFSKFGSGQTIF